MKINEYPLPKLGDKVRSRHHEYDLGVVIGIRNTKYIDGNEVDVYIVRWPDDRVRFYNRKSLNDYIEVIKDA